uniref:Uncharacterized protein n=1 Tax=Rhizophora mucronata TaxID=61149 RepID=A0A2P2PY53_RHIMU
MIIENIVLTAWSTNFLAFTLCNRILVFSITPSCIVTLRRFGGS